jgi:hypothetical protein
VGQGVVAVGSLRSQYLMEYYVCQLLFATRVGGRTSIRFRLEAYSDVSFQPPLWRVIVERLVGALERASDERAISPTHNRAKEKSLQKADRAEAFEEHLLRLLAFELAQPYAASSQAIC